MKKDDKMVILSIICVVAFIAIGVLEGIYG